jgi:hypothetical protein
MGMSAWRRENEETGGPGTVVGSAGQSAMALDQRAWAALLPREQRRAAGTGNAGGVADEQDRDEVGPGGSRQGVREKERE